LKSFIKKIAKPLAIGVFFMALFFNVKLSLTDPFINLDNAALAQTSSSGGGTVDCYSILQGSEGQSVACSPCSLATGIPPWYHFGGKCTPS
jgi:hypothetical protein